MAEMGTVDPLRRLAGLMGGNILAASRTQAEHDAAMAHARAGLLAALEREADPDGTLRESDPEELARRVKHLRRAKMADLALRSVAARRAKAEAARDAEDRVAAALALLAEGGVG